MMVYCETCKDFVNYDVKNVRLTKSLRKITILYCGKAGYCKLCANAVHVSDIRDDNLSELEKRINEIEAEEH